VHISAELLKRYPDWTQLSGDHCVGILQSLLLQLEEISTLAGRRVAIFVDDYDRPCVRALERGESFEEMNMLFFYFYTALKASSNFVPFLFITGSSRIRLVDFFGGANDITDLSFDARVVTALGYTWTEIETLYSEQLPLLQRLHDMTREELKAKMERWYGGYRWSQDLDVSVFNPLSVNQFVQSGTFKRHWTSAGTSSLVFNKRLFDRDMMRLLLVKGARVELSTDDLIGCSGHGTLQVDMSTRSQVALLVSRGVLSFAPECSVNQTYLPLYFPNIEARSQAEAILRNAFARLLRAVR
jgi:hypothetical protein